MEEACNTLPENENPWNILSENAKEKTAWKN